MKYDQSFYEAQQAGSLRSARAVVPVVIDAVRPASVLDVGCGVGTWLAAFVEAGISDVVGMDGDYVSRAMLKISPDRFQAADLSRKQDTGRMFDLAISLEVGEHLPPDSTDALVETLVNAAPVVLFSAAIPYQGGTDHINERWQQDWADRFIARGYVAVDLLRPRFWNDDRVELFYRQNMLIYVRASFLDKYPALRAARERTADGLASVVHPCIYAGRNMYPLAPLGHLWRWTLRQTVSALKRALMGR